MCEIFGEDPCRSLPSYRLSAFTAWLKRDVGTQRRVKYLR
jgi:hypothetical protein